MKLYKTTQKADAVNDMAHALGDDRAAAGLSRSSPNTPNKNNSVPGSLRDRYTNGGQNTENENTFIRGDNVPTSRIVGFGTSPPVGALQRGGGKSFKERAFSKLERVKRKTQEALQARKERQTHFHHEGQSGGNNVSPGSASNNEAARQMQRAIRRESVSDVVMSATSAAELLFELRACLEDSDGGGDGGGGGEVDVSAHDMIAEMTHLCEERRARLAGLAGDEGLSETNLVLVLETIEKVNGALDSGIGGSSNAFSTSTTTIAVNGEDEDGVPLPPVNPLGVSPGNPFATPVASASSPTTPAPTTRTVAPTDVPQTPEEEEAALAAAIAASLQIEEENKQKQASSSSPPTQHHHQQQQVSRSNDIGNLIDF
jgi:hypothetical protein